MNMKVWNYADETDIKYTKRYKGIGGFEGTAINPTYINMRATALFGPCGIGWGYEIVNEQYIQGGPLGKSDENLGTTLIHVLTISLWYLLDGVKGTVTGFGTTPFIYADKYGVKTDHEAQKKSLTDAIKSCFSKLGFSADIYLGMFDDADYVNEISSEFARRNAEDKIAESVTKAKAKKEYQAKVLEDIETSNPYELDAIYSVAARIAKVNNESEFAKVIALKYKERKANMVKQNETV